MLRRESSTALERAIDQFWYEQYIWHTRPWYQRLWLRLTGRGPRGIEPGSYYS